MTIEDLLIYSKESDDFVQFCYPHTRGEFWISYFTSLVDSKFIHKQILPYLKRGTYFSLKELQAVIPMEFIELTNDIEQIQSKLMLGHIMIQYHPTAETCLLISANMNQARDVAIPEEEFSVVGPKESFVESIQTNLNLIRKRLPCLQLQIKEYVVGTLSKTKIAILYMKDIANEEDVHTVIQRVQEIEYHQILDSSYITEMISDNNYSVFPQLIDTERPDRVAGVLGEGKVVILVDGSPHALIGPTTLIEFFSASEDYFIHWQIASFFRAVRLVGVIFSIMATPLYVAVLNYHYVLIPKDLISTLVISRSTIPLPPILEAVILELTIELLREAGARLPTKVGQTIGIVGGIVIGTASVEAGLTSNVLLIIVALSALASFTTPIYKMGNAIRLIRFPFLLFAELWGVIGVAISFMFILVHLLTLTSLGRPYLEPLYPFRFSDFKDSFIRLPLSKQSERPIYTQAKDKIRFSKKAARQNKDMDE